MKRVQSCDIIPSNPKNLIDKPSKSQSFGLNKFKSTTNWTGGLSIPNTPERLQNEIILKRTSVIKHIGVLKDTEKRYRKREIIGHKNQSNYIEKIGILLKDNINTNDENTNRNNKDQDKYKDNINKVEENKYLENDNFDYKEILREHNKFLVPILRYSKKHVYNFKHSDRESNRDSSRPQTSTFKTGLNLNLSDKKIVVQAKYHKGWQHKKSISTSMNNLFRTGFKPEEIENPIQLPKEEKKVYPVFNRKSEVTAEENFQRKGKIGENVSQNNINKMNKIFERNFLPVTKYQKASVAKNISEMDKEIENNFACKLINLEI